MTFNSDIHHRRSIRLQGYDYAQAGAYFVTICAWQRECLFGDIVDGTLRLNEFGQAVVDSWNWMSMQYPHVELDAWVVMPNHLHGVILVTDCRGGSRTAPTKKIKPLGRLIGAFKTVSAKQINLLRQSPGLPVWQRNYYERVIRSQTELEEVREYIFGNPLKWAEDEDNPAGVGAVREPPLRQNEPPLQNIAPPRPA